MHNRHLHNKSKSRRQRLGVCLAAITGVAFMPAAIAQTPAEDLLSLDRPLVIAHRGYSMIAPENTIPAFELGNLAGADMVELDYYVSKDGVAMSFHDRTLDRTSNIIEAWGVEGKRVADYSARALKTLDVGSWFHESFTGLRMPTLVESLDVIQSAGGITLIERKEGEAADLVQIIRQHNLVNEVVVQAFDWDFLREIHDELPDQVLGALGPNRVHNGRNIPREERELSPYWVDEAMKAGVRVIGWNRQVNPEAIAYAQSKGIKIWVYTINDAELADQLLEMGVDGIITDNTSLIWRTVALRALNKSK